MTSDDYIFLYSKLSIDKIPLHIKEKIDSGDEFTEVEKQEILKTIRKEKMRSLPYVPPYHGDIHFINSFVFKGQRVDNGEYIIGRIGLPHIVKRRIDMPNKEVETEMWVYENKNKRKPWKMYYVKTETIVML